MVALVLLDTSEGASHGSRITSMANRHSDSDHPPDLAIRRAARLSVRHDFHAFSALRSQRTPLVRFSWLVAGGAGR